jgi:hypothetical protein
MISSTQLLGFLMHPKGGRKRPRRGHSLICSLQGFEREKEDEVSDRGTVNIGSLIVWRAHGGLVPCLFTKELLDLRRAHLRRRAHRQWGGLREINLQ